MRLDDWLKAEKGRATALAKHLGVGLASVSQYRTSGVPTKYMRRVVVFTKNKVTLDDLLADVEASRA